MSSPYVSPFGSDPDPHADEDWEYPTPEEVAESERAKAERASAALGSGGLDLGGLGAGGLESGGTGSGWLGSGGGVSGALGSAGVGRVGSESRQRLSPPACDTSRHNGCSEPKKEEHLILSEDFGQSEPENDQELLSGPTYHASEQDFLMDRGLLFEELKGSEYGGSPLCQRKRPKKLAIGEKSKLPEKVLFESCESRSCMACCAHRAAFDAKRYALAIYEAQAVGGHTWYEVTVPRSAIPSMLRYVDAREGLSLTVPTTEVSEGGSEMVTVLATAISPRIRALYGHRDMHENRYVMRLDQQVRLEMISLVDYLEEAFKRIPPHRRLSPNGALGRIRKSIESDVLGSGRLATAPTSTGANLSNGKDWMTDLRDRLVRGPGPSNLITVINPVQFMRSAKRGEFDLDIFAGWVHKMPATDTRDWKRQAIPWGMNPAEVLDAASYERHLEGLRHYEIGMVRRAA
jgi:hypothetical protein